MTSLLRAHYNHHRHEPFSNSALLLELETKVRPAPNNADECGTLWEAGTMTPPSDGHR